MQYLFPAVVVVMLALFGIQLTRTSRPKSRDRAIDRMIRQARLALPPELEVALTARVVAREKAMLLGSMSVLALSAVPIYLTSDRGLGLWSGFLLVVATVCGAAVGELVAETRSAFAPAPTTARIARSSAPVLSDYLSRLERWYSPLYLVLAAAGLIAAATMMTVNPADTFAPGSLGALLLPAGLLILALVAWALGALASRRLLERGQPATTLTELAWDDALRSVTLRSLSWTPGTIAASSGLVTLFSLGAAAAVYERDTVDSAISAATGLGLLVLVLPFLALAFLTNRSGHPPHYLSRLWSETAAQVAASRGGYGPIISRETDADGSDAAFASDRAHSKHPGS